MQYIDIKNDISIFLIFRIITTANIDISSMFNIKVRMILALGYWVLANTDQYWGGSGIGRYFLTVKSNTDICSLSISGRRPPLSAV